MREFMKAPIVAVVATCGLAGAAFAADTSAPVLSPTFVDAVIPPGQARCAQGFSSTRSPDNRVLSVLRSAKTSKNKEFLAVGPGFGTRDRAACTIDVAFERRLQAPRTLSVDYRGLEDKQPHTRVSLVVTIGSQAHRFSYADGRWLDGTPGTDIKRFLVDVPTGVKRLRISVSGTATSTNGTDSALIGFDALDMCFVDPENPDYCGLASQPNRRATP